MKIKFFKALLVLFSLLIIPGFSTNNNLRSYDQGHAIEEDQMTAAYNSAARIDVEEAWDFYITASLIYWQPRQDGLELGFTASEDPAIQGSMINMDFDYKPGFKIGAGMNFDHDNWGMYGEYTWLHCKNHKSKQVDPDVMTLADAWMREEADKISARWKMDLDIIDLNLCRAHYIGTKLTFNTHFGLRGGFLDQRYTQKGFQEEERLTVQQQPMLQELYEFILHSDTWFIGPRIGLEAKWLLGEGFRIFGNVAASLLYQRFKTIFTSHSTSDLIGQFLSNGALKDKKGKIIPNIELNIGLGWGTYFDNRNWHLDLAASYDFQIFWNQNQLHYVRDIIYMGTDGSAGDLILHGLTIKARLDF